MSGEARVTKGDGVTLEILSPDILSGITIKSSKEEPQTISFSYYGIDTKLPDGALKKINMLLSFFSSTIPSVLASPGGCEITPVPEYTLPDGTVCPAYSCAFDFDRINYSIIYDPQSGTPYEITASNGEAAVTAKIGKFKPE